MYVLTTPAFPACSTNHKSHKVALNQSRHSLLFAGVHKKKKCVSLDLAHICIFLFRLKPLILRWTSGTNSSNVLHETHSKMHYFVVFLVCYCYRCSPYCTVLFVGERWIGVSFKPHHFRSRSKQQWCLVWKCMAACRVCVCARARVCVSSECVSMLVFVWTKQCETNTPKAWPWAHCTYRNVKNMLYYVCVILRIRCRTSVVCRTGLSEQR